MPFSRPDLQIIISRTRDDVVSRLPNPDVLRRSDAEVYSRALAGAAHGLYGYLDWLAKQLIYDTAETAYLERWAGIWGVSRKLATAATGTVTFSGANGATIPAGTVLSAYDGQLFSTASIATIALGSAVVTVNAMQAGSAADRASGQTFTLQSPVDGVYATALAGAMTGGADIETDDSLRSRLLLRISTPPQGGSKSDYMAWALAVPGVTRAWVYPLELGAGTVTVRFMMDSSYANGIPLAGDVVAVANYIDPLRPVTAVVTVVAPIPAPINFIISALSPPTLAVKAAITANLADLILSEASPGGTLLLSHVNEAISTATDEFDHVLTYPTTNVVSSTGVVSTMGTMTWA